MLSNSIRAAVIGFARTLATETAPFGITVNNLLPGFTRTERMVELSLVTRPRKGSAPKRRWPATRRRYQWDGWVSPGNLPRWRRSWRRTGPATSPRSRWRWTGVDPGALVSRRDNPTYHTDIQALRGYAVLLVLVYHAQLAATRAGYLGVDVFFVISGFLMTRVITDGITAGGFTFAGFYWRRAKRLLPPRTRPSWSRRCWRRCCSPRWSSVPLKRS